MGSVNILQGLNPHFGTASGFLKCNRRIQRVQEMINNPDTTPDERNSLTLDLAKLYSWQARNLRKQVADAYK